MLRLPGFRRLAGAYLVNELGNWLGEVALAIAVLELTGSPIATAALFVAMQFVPALLAPPIVARMDSVPTRRALSLVYLLEALSFVALAALVDDAVFALAPVLVLAAIDGSLASAARAQTRAAAAAVLEPAGALREGNGVLNIGFTLGATIGPVIAGVLVATAGAQTALLADAGTFVAVALLLGLGGSISTASTDESGSWLTRLAEGLAHVRSRPVLARLLALESLAFVFFALVLPIEVAFAKETLGAGDVGYGLLLGAWGAGMVFGSVLFTWLRSVALGPLLIASTLAIGLAYAGTAVAPTLVIACGASVLGGTGNGIQWVGMVTAIQGMTTAALQPRVLSLLESVTSAASGIGFIAGGVIAAELSPRASYAVAGIGVLVILSAAVPFIRALGANDVIQAAQTQADGPESAQI